MYVMHLDGGTICFVVLDVYFLGGIVGGGEFILVVCMWCILMGNCPGVFDLGDLPQETSCPYDEDQKSEGLGDQASDPFPVCDVAEGTPPLHSPANVWNTDKVHLYNSC